MFHTLSQRLTTLFDQLKNRGSLSETDVNTALREIRVALLEADVALPVVKSFIERVRVQAVGQAVLKSLTPGQVVVKIVHDHLVDLLRHPDGHDLNLAAQPPVVILMVGLQGSGKTTTTAKIAAFLTTQLRKKVLMTSVDIYRPAAREQLARLGETAGLATTSLTITGTPRHMAGEALTQARSGGFDVLLVDTAGRLHIDEALMDELIDLKNLLAPQEILLTADAMTGQDAALMASTFHARLNLTGIVLSRLDGDARGGAALSMRAVTGQPIKFLGMGEKIEALEPFHPERIADRILGMGDIVALVEKITASVTEVEMEKAALRMQKGLFTLDDMASQMRQVLSMGSLTSLLDMIPGMGALKAKMGPGMDDATARQNARRQLAIISAMTPKERHKPDLLNASRRRRIAKGSGTQVQDVNRLIKQYDQMALMMKRMGKMGKKGLLRNGIGSLLGR